MRPEQRHGFPSRREFIQSTAATTAALLATRSFGYAAGSDTLKIGLVGCGGRGTGAVSDCLSANEGVELVALGDLFPDRLADCRSNLAGAAELAGKIKLADERCFSGFDAYQKVIASGVDLVLLATPPGFRPIHLEAAIAAGKNVFMEKPVAVDPAGIRKVLAASEMAAQKKLAIVAGTQRRHQAEYLETMKRIHDGAIGELVGAQCAWNQGSLWMNPRKPEWTDVEWQIRNWLYFAWLSGDHICEQHIHNLDVINWAMGSHPSKCVGLGGRQVRTDPAYGHIYDHFAIEYEYPNGARLSSQCRQIDNCANWVGERVVGTKGSSDPSGTIHGATSWRYEGEKKNPYQVEHADLVASIRAGKPLNEGRQVAESTLTAIMGRMSAYTGKEVTWEQALASKLELMPAKLGFGPLPVPPVALPGKG